MSSQKFLLQTFAPQILHKRLKETPEHAPITPAQHVIDSLEPPVVVTNDLINNANKMSAQVTAILPATSTDPKE